MGELNVMIISLPDDVAAALVRYVADLEAPPLVEDAAVDLVRAQLIAAGYLDPPAEGE